MDVEFIGSSVEFLGGPGFFFCLCFLFCLFVVDSFLFVFCFTGYVCVIRLISYNRSFCLFIIRNNRSIISLCICFCADVGVCVNVSL